MTSESAVASSECLWIRQSTPEIAAHLCSLATVPLKYSALNLRRVIRSMRNDASGSRSTELESNLAAAQYAT